MISVTYSGGWDAVDIKLPSRWLLNVQRGATVSVTNEEAERLLEIPGWDATFIPSEEDEI